MTIKAALGNGNAMTKATLVGTKLTGFEVAYAKHLNIFTPTSASSITGSYKTGCKLTANVASRRSSSTSITYKAVVSALLSGGAYTAARTFTKAQFQAALNAVKANSHTGTIALADILKIAAPSMTWSSASTTSITGFLSLLAAAWCWTQQ